jgi:large repetitive protein
VAFRIVRRFAAAAGVAFLAAAANARQVDLAGLARCVSASGAIFYGAHWCPICAKQKEYFDGYAYLLPYVECYDGPKKDGRNAQCKKLDIEHYPTWVFPDGRVETGADTPEELAAKTGCPLR